jgi:hypothetical protein
MDAGEYVYGVVASSQQPQRLVPQCFNLCDAFPALFKVIDETKTGELESVSTPQLAVVNDGNAVSDFFGSLMCSLQDALCVICALPPSAPTCLHTH